MFTDTAIALKCELCACDFINTVSKHFTCMAACKKVLVVVDMFVLTYSFTFFLLFWLCKFQSIEPEIKPSTVPPNLYFNFKLDSRVCGTSPFSTVTLLGAQNLLLELALKPEQNSCLLLGLQCALECFRCFPKLHIGDHSLHKS